MLGRIKLFTVLIAVFSSSIPFSVSALDKPVINFSDLTAAPNSGWSAAQPSQGAVVTVWGRNFGSARDDSYVTVNGVKLQSNSDYAEAWGETSKPIPFLQRISFWLNSNVPSGSGEISITVDGQTSEPIPFRVGGGNIYFVDINAMGSGVGSITEPWSDVADYIDVMAPGDIAYFREGVYDEKYNGGKSNIWVRVSEPSGTQTQPIAFVGYPGETALFDSVTHGDSTSFNRSISIDAFYITISKLATLGYGAGIEAGGYGRVVGNDVVGAKVFVSGTGMIISGKDGLKILGNSIHGARSENRLDHGVYLTGCSPVEGAEVAYNHSYDNSFDRGPHIVVNHQVTRCESNEQLKSHYIHNNLIDCSNFRSRGIGLFDLSWDLDDEADEPEPTYVYNNIMNACGRGDYGAMYHNNGHGVFYNNIAYDSQGPGLSVSGGLVLSSIAVNNIFHQRESDEDYLTGPATVEDSNLYFAGNNASISVSATNAVLTDPLLTIDLNAFNFVLAANSPAIGAGSSTVLSIVKQDFFSKLRQAGSGIDIGALQYNDAPTPPPPPPPVPEGISDLCMPIKALTGNLAIICL